MNQQKKLFIIHQNYIVAVIICKCVLTSYSNHLHSVAHTFIRFNSNFLVIQFSEEKKSFILFSQIFHTSWKWKDVIL